MAPGKLTTGADWAAALAANGVACLYDLYKVAAHSEPGTVTSSVL